MTFVIGGLADFDGETLGVFLAGLDCGDFPVLDTQITVPTDGTDASGLLTDHYLTQVTALGRDWGLNTAIVGAWNVPLVLGYRYVSRAQLLRPVSAADTGAQAGPGFGKFKRNHEVAVQVTSTRNLRIGTSFDRMNTMVLSSPGGTLYSPTELFTGILVDAIADESSYDAMLCWEVDGPYSAMINAIGGFIQTEDK